MVMHVFLVQWKRESAGEWSLHEPDQRENLYGRDFITCDTTFTAREAFAAANPNTTVIGVRRLCKAVATPAKPTMRQRIAKRETYKE